MFNKYFAMSLIIIMSAMMTSCANTNYVVIVKANDKKIREFPLEYRNVSDGLKKISDMFNKEEYDEVILQARAILAVWDEKISSLEAAKIACFASLFRYTLYRNMADLTPENHYHNNTCLRESIEFAKVLSIKDNHQEAWKTLQNILEKGFYNPEAFGQLVLILRKSLVLQKNKVEFRTDADTAEMCNRIFEEYPVWSSKHRLKEFLRMIEKA